MSVWSEFWRSLTLRGGHNASVAIVALALLGVAAGIVGVYALLRKRSLLSDALSHAGLPGVALAFIVATALGAPGRSMAWLLAGAAVFGALAAGSVQLMTRVPRWKEDGAIAAALSVYFALGVVLLSYVQIMPSGERAGLGSFIFGQAAALSREDAWRMAAVCALVALAALSMHKAMRLVCFDRAFAQAIGWRAGAIDALMLGLIVLVSVLGMQAVGIMLIVALLIIPAAAARFWTERAGRMLMVSALIGGVSCWVGGALSAAMAAMPTGPVVVCVCAAAFLVSMLFAPRRGVLAHAARGWRTREVVARDHLLRALVELDERLDTPITAGEVVAMRSWGPGRVRRLLRGAARRGEAARAGGGWALTALGRERGGRLVRNHRLWEMYLITYADLAPGHVDRVADEVEHVLGADLVRRLEAQLAREGLPTERPASPHAIGAPAPSGGAP